MERIRVLDVEFDNVTAESAVERAIGLIRSGDKGYIVTPNSEIVYESRRNNALKSALMHAFLVLPDGIGVVYAARLQKKPLMCKVAGIDFASLLCDRLQRTGIRLFLLGAKPQIAEKAANRLKDKYPGLIICGVKDGYFKDDMEAVRAIQDAAADVVFVCLGAPKQELFMQAYLEDTSAKLLVGLGGSLDVFAGEVKRAPDIYIRLGLEWFYRLAKEPKRIGRMARLPLFLVAAIWESLKGGAGKK